MKLHLGVGDVYLQDYVNIDIHIEGYSFLASDRPDLVEQNLTTEENYYKKLYQGAREGGFEFRCVADRFLDFKDLPYPDNSVEKILAVQCLEHLAPEDAQKALAEWHRVLEPSGVVIIDVPDFEGLARQLLAQPYEDDKEYYYKMIFGSHKNQYAIHKEGYSFVKLELHLLQAGFRGVKDLSNIFNHPYPSITVEAWKEAS